MAVGDIEGKPELKEGYEIPMLGVSDKLKLRGDNRTDDPSGVIAASNPCKVIHEITDSEKTEYLYSRRSEQAAGQGRGM